MLLENLKRTILIRLLGLTESHISAVYEIKGSKKTGHYVPGTRIPIFPPDYLKKNQPDFLLILPWNIADEIKLQLSYLKKKKTKFLVAIPKLKIL